jgi:hypothetical protein
MEMVRIELKGVKEAMAMFDPNKVRLAANQALNRVAITGRKEASNIISTGYNIKPSILRKKLLLDFKASGYKSYAVITGEGRGISLRHFDPRQEGVKVTRGLKGRVKFLGKPGFRRGGQVTAQIRRSGPRSVITELRSKWRTYLNKPFVTRNAEGVPVVWARKGKERFPVTEGMGPGVALLFGSRHIMERVRDVINTRFAGEFKRQLDYYLGRIK